MEMNANASTTTVSGNVKAVKYHISDENDTSSSCTIVYTFIATNYRVQVLDKYQNIGYSILDRTRGLY